MVISPLLETVTVLVVLNVTHINISTDEKENKKLEKGFKL